MFIGTSLLTLLLLLLVLRTHIQGGEVELVLGV
jgi:hypothetical protein